MPDLYIKPVIKQQYKSHSNHTAIRLKENGTRASEWQQQAARKHFILGLVLAEISENDCAIELFQTALSYDPTLVAAHVAMGLTYSQMEAYPEMLTAFGEAIRLDPLSARAAAVNEPKEVKLIERILNPPVQAAATIIEASGMPAEFVEAGNLLHAVMDHLVEGRDEEAIQALERSLRIGPTFQLVISLLSLAYLLRQQSEAESLSLTAMGESVLWEIEPELAKLIFKA